MPDGPGYFTQDSSCPALLRIPIGFMSLRIQDCHLLWCDFPDTSARDTSCHALVLQPPGGRTLRGLGSSPVARHYWGNHVLFSLPLGTKMFQFPWFASAISGWQSFRLPGCPIRKSRDQWPFAPTPGLSQLVTSFIACESLGIRHTPFFTFARTELLRK